MVVEAMIAALEGLNLHLPAPAPQDNAWIAEARRQLEQEG